MISNETHIIYRDVRIETQMQPSTNASYSRLHLLRDALEFAKQRMSSRIIANGTNVLVVPPPLSYSIDANLVGMILGIGYILIVIAFLVQTLLRMIRKLECYYMSPSYNRFEFAANEEYYESDPESESVETSYDETLQPQSSPISLRPTLSGKGKYLHIKTPFQTQKTNAVIPKTPLPVRRSLRLKIKRVKSELNLSAMENNANSAIMTRSQTKQNQPMTTTTSISSDPCPRNIYRSSITTPSPHPEHDEELAFYVRYCNEKKMKNKRPEFNSPLFVRRLVL